MRAAAGRSVGLRAERATDGAARAAALAPLEAAAADERPGRARRRRGAARPAACGAAAVAALLARPERRDPARGAALRRRARRRGGLERLLPLVAHPDWSVRAEAMEVLAERGLPPAVPAILRRLETEQDEFVRSARCARWRGSRARRRGRDRRQARAALSDAEFRMFAELLRGHCGLHFGPETASCSRSASRGACASSRSGASRPTTPAAHARPATTSSASWSTRSPPTRPTSSASAASSPRWSSEILPESRAASDARPRPDQRLVGRLLERRGAVQHRDPGDGGGHRPGRDLRVYASDISRRMLRTRARAPIARTPSARPSRGCARGTSPRRTASGASRTK